MKMFNRIYELTIEKKIQHIQHINCFWIKNLDSSTVYPNEMQDLCGFCDIFFKI